MLKTQGKSVKAAQYRRLVLLSAMISALIRGRRASLKCIGQHLPYDIDLESRIKKAKRWLDSKYTTYQSFFLPYIKPILESLAKAGPLFLAIDGSEVGCGSMGLMISVVYKKRSIPICWLIRKGSKGHLPEQMHLDLLNTVVDILPPDCPIVLLGDGEFDGIGIQKFCRQNQWDYVLRTAKDTIITIPGQEAFSIKDLYPANGEKYCFAPQIRFSKKQYGPVNVMCWHDYPKYKNPIFLVTNLELPQLAARYYRKRASIETLFGDIKSRGFSIHRTRIAEPCRLQSLLLVTCLAYLLTFSFGKQVREKVNFIGKFCRKERLYELSIFSLGLNALQYLIDFQKAIPPNLSMNFL